MRYVAIGQLDNSDDGQKPHIQTIKKDSEQIPKTVSQDTAPKLGQCKDPQDRAQDELRRKKSEEAFKIWKENKAKEEKQKRQALKLMEEKKKAEENEKLEEIRKVAITNRENWLKRKTVQTKKEKKKKEEELDKAKEKQNEKRMLSREVVATWMQISRNRPKPVSSNVFEMARMKVSFINPQPWRGVLD